MLKNTRAAFNLIKFEISLFAHIAKIVSTVIILAYLAFSLIIGRGLFAVNVVLCAITAVNFIVYLILRKKKDKKSKKVRKIVKHSYVITKIVLNAIPLATLILSVIFAPDKILIADVVFLPIMLLLWIAQVALEVVSLYVQSRIALFVDSIQEDFKFVITPVLKVKNFIKRIRPDYDSEDTDADNTEESEKSSKSDIFSKVIKTGEAIKELIKK